METAKDIEKSSKKNRHRIRRIILRCLIGAAAVAVVCAPVFWWVVPLFYPLPSDLETWTPPGIVVRDRSGKALAHLPSPDHYRGGHTPLQQLPEDFVKATLAAEDKRFYAHGGIDFLATLRAVHSHVTLSRKKSGASTISQQLIKLANPKGPRTVGVKFREWMTARHLEMTYDKDFILSGYFDRLDYGNLRIGPSAAAEYYFGKRLDELSLGQMATLAALPQSPTRLNPRKNSEKAIERRNWILSRMEEEFGYDKSRISRAQQEPLDMAAGATETILAPHLMSKILGSRKTNGEVNTTIDAELQGIAEQTAKTILGQLSDRQATQAAVLVIHNKTGEILAWVGSSNRRDPQGGLLDGVLLPRSAGSTLKPFVYALAFGKGHWAGEILADVPVTFRSNDGYDAPRNYNNSYMGPVSVREALACSQNIPAMSLLQESGGARELMRLLKELGFTSLNKPPSHYGLGLAIGNAEATLLEITNAYAALARRGVTKEAFWQKNGMSKQDGMRILPEDACFVLESILSDNVARAAAFGSTNPLNFSFPCAAKTGTSSDYRDNWCIGYTRDITVGVWIGNFDFRPMRNISGVTGAGPIFHIVMNEAHKRYPSAFNPPTDGVESVTIDRRNGLRETDGDIPARYVAREWAFKSSLPRFAQSTDYDQQGRALLDSRYDEWYGSKHNTRGNDFALSPLLWHGETARVTAPPSNSTLVIDPEMPNSARILRLKSNLPDGVEWTSETLRILDDNGFPAAELAPGTHTIKAKHDRLELECEAIIHVKQL